MADGQVSVGGALSYAWALLSQNWRSIWGALALNALGWTVLVAGRLSVNLELMVLGLLGVMLTKYPLYGSIVRAAGGQPSAVAKAGGAHLGLQWRSEELRMLAADLLFVVFMVIVGALLAIALLAPIVGVLMSTGANLAAITTPEQMLKALGPRGQAIMEAESLVFWIIMYAIGFRLSTSLVASASAGRVALLSTWRLTRGHLLQIVGASVVVNLPLILAVVVTGAGAAGSTGSTSVISPSEIFVYALLTGILAGAATTPLLAGVQIYFYQRLGPLPPREVREPKA